MLMAGWRWCGVEGVGPAGVQRDGNELAAPETGLNVPELAKGLSGPVWLTGCRCGKRC